MQKIHLEIFDKELFEKKRHYLFSALEIVPENQSIIWRKILISCRIFH
jgi:hypothetical protein